jgi:hypothetical protein
MLFLVRILLFGGFMDFRDKLGWIGDYFHFSIYRSCVSFLNFFGFVSFSFSNPVIFFVSFRFVSLSFVSFRIVFEFFTFFRFICQTLLFIDNRVILSDLFSVGLPFAAFWNLNNKWIHKKIKKITNKTNKITKIFVFLSVLYVILLIFHENF